VECIVPEASWPTMRPVVELMGFPIPPWCQKWTCGDVSEGMEKAGMVRGTHVAAAYADVGDADYDIVGVEELGDGLVFQSCGFGAVEDYGGVFHLGDGR
jgi:hypothetical protein